MRKTLLIFCAAFFVSSFQAQESKAVSATDVISTVVGKATKMTSMKSVQDTLCKKGAVWGGTITGRSGGGIACRSSTTFAALMKFTCADYEGFDGSACSDAINQKFGNDADAKKAIQDAIAHNKDKLGGVVCAAAKVVPRLQVVVGNSCSAGQK